MPSTAMDETPEVKQKKERKPPAPDIPWIEGNHQEWWDEWKQVCDQTHDISNKDRKYIDFMYTHREKDRAWWLTLGTEGTDQTDPFFKSDAFYRITPPGMLSLKFEKMSPRFQIDPKDGYLHLKRAENSDS